jgi:ubiquitin C-terminal hydrolase
MKINNKQQTAVEWLAEQMEILHYDYWAEHISKDEKNQRLKQLKEQAKEMEKGKAIKLHYEYELYVMMNESVVITFGQFYEQTYGGGEQ